MKDCTVCMLVAKVYNRLKIAVRQFIKVINLLVVMHYKASLK